MMDPRDMPTAGDYAWQEATNARNIAEGAAKADVTSRAELEKQVFVLRGQVAFLTEFLTPLLRGKTAHLTESDWKTLEQIKENIW